jgi:hypothetical protein
MSGLVSSGDGGGGGRVLTTLRVPMRTCGGAWSAETISDMKFDVIPIMVMREIACMARTTVKVAPRAPKFWLAILMGEEIGCKYGRGA